MCMSRLSVCLCNWFLWLALDLSKTDEYLALKFLTLKCSTRDNTEMRILKKLGKLRCAFFYKHINNLEYLCLGMDPAGSSLHDRENSEVPLPSSISTITTFISCLVNRVLTLHQLGIHHGGECFGITWETYTGRANIDFFNIDITSKNVVLGLHKDAFTSEALHNSFMCDCNVDIFYIGEEGEAPSLPPNLPKYIVQHEEIGLLTDKEDMSKVDLIDFGLCTFFFCWSMCAIQNLYNRSFWGAHKDEGLGNQILPGAWEWRRTVCVRKVRFMEFRLRGKLLASVSQSMPSKYWSMLPIASLRSSRREFLRRTWSAWLPECVVSTTCLHWLYVLIQLRSWWW